MAACPTFALISLSTLSPGPQGSRSKVVHTYQAVKELHFWKGARELATIFFLQQNLLYYQKHVFVETYGLNYWPSVSCLCFFPAADSLPPSGCSSGNRAYSVLGTEFMPPFLNPRSYEPSK